MELKTLTSFYISKQLFDFLKINNLLNNCINEPIYFLTESEIKDIFKNTNSYDFYNKDDLNLALKDLKEIETYVLNHNLDYIILQFDY